MPLFEKIIEESKGGSNKADETLQDKIRRQKIHEVDETTADRIIQAERTKEAELLGREAEGHRRVADAQASIMDRAMPQAAWGFFAELLKDRNPQSPMTVEDMLRILDYSRGQETGPEQPPDGIYGVLTALITQMGTNRQQVTPLELIQAIQAMTPPNTQGSQLSQLGELATAFSVLKNAFVPQLSSPPQQGFPSQGVDAQGNPVGPVFNLPIPSIVDIVKLDREQKREDRKVEMWEGIADVIKREAPRAAGALERQGQRRAGKGDKGAAPEIEQAAQDMTFQTCSDCGTVMGIPKTFKKGDLILCINPQCPSHSQPEAMEGHRA